MAGALLDKLVWVWLSVTSPVVPGEKKKKNEVSCIKMQEFKSFKAHRTTLKTTFLTEILFLPCILTDFTTNHIQWVQTQFVRAELEIV